MRYEQLLQADAEKVLELMRVFAKAFEDEENYSSHIPSTEYTKRLLRNQNNIVLVATTDKGEVAGGLVAYELQKFEQERSEVYLYDLAVLESHRRQGIAIGLIKTLKVIAKDRGAEVIFVQADTIDQPAVALYTKLATSIEEDVTHFDILTHGNPDH